MRTHDLTIGRTFGVTFDHDEDFLAAVGEACRANGIRQGYIPMFIAGFAEARIVGTCERLDDPVAPVQSSVYLTNTEVLGGGTLAYDPGEDRVMPHIHITAGLKAHSATGHTSHLLSARVQLLTEMVIVEIREPEMRRLPRPGPYRVPILRFGPEFDFD